MRRHILLAAAAASLLVAACGSSGPGGPAGTTGAEAGTAAPSMLVGDQFGGDVCTALTGAEIEGSTFPQGSATFASTDTQKDEATGKPVVCQYLVVFGDKPSTVGVAVSLMDATEFGTRTEASLLAPPAAVSGIGSEAYLLQPAPGLYEVWVAGANGMFKVSAQSKETAIALAKLAAARD